MLVTDLVVSVPAEPPEIVAEARRVGGSRLQYYRVYLRIYMGVI